ncbi:UDP-glucose--hexose-1-phosphate uridylyltransferase [Saccharibacillus sp. CPCC 101409]|uniref:UDP-glucose--hexose-1-phosphate uridylyltransferase n=1 Tax=Saccharibacillus sp. CPCC 101409 TaxID=3058041 RepID=UPI0026732455|nr:UDP-glucose--hexose-1-phosphate uridylyltransferase [Saccharibacillus sp. CPCC 101409]MDO3409050.1 UDP-glucose--hexose-1-phosphate uridylyltransferase [Saccharibacillus sp. CPCC 101409]
MSEQLKNGVQQGTAGEKPGDVQRTETGRPENGEVSREQALIATERLTAFALEAGLLEAFDADYGRNRLLEQFGFDEPYGGEDALAESLPEGPQPMLDALIDYAAQTGMIPENTDTQRDLLDAKLMGLLIARPSEIVRDFNTTAELGGIEAATDRFYKWCIDSNYIRMDRVSKNLYWTHDSEYGPIEITINLSKPEKTPEEIAQARLLPPPVYPKCQLCRENVGYAGRINHPARQNLRVIPIELNDEPWLFQYSPYVYYNEHCIVLHRDHVPMKLTKDTLRRLLRFTDRFPHYFLGSNADLPIVGGSILTHDHFQGGKHTFAIERAVTEAVFAHNEYPSVRLEVVRWPMSVIRLSGSDQGELLEAANTVYETWKTYSDESAGVRASSDKDGESVRHNTVTPIVRRREGGTYELDLVLRNNRTSEEHPEGIFHPHREMHHLKKENIGLIEVMGLAILPGRLKDELELIGRVLSGDSRLLSEAESDVSHPLAQHLPWVRELIGTGGSDLTDEAALDLVRREVGAKFTEILEHAGVYKTDAAGREAFFRFVSSLGWNRTDAQ